MLFGSDAGDKLLVAERAEVMPAFEVAVFLADGEERGDGDVGHLEVGEYFAYDVAAGFRGGDGFVHVHVEDGTTGVAALQLVLHL